jgi:hypothetical protein
VWEQPTHIIRPIHEQNLAQLKGAIQLSLFEMYIAELHLSYGESKTQDIQEINRFCFAQAG